MGKEMHHYSHKKGNSSLLSRSPLSYAVELTAESPLLISNSGFGCSYGIHPLADCVKSASLLLLGIKKSLFIVLQIHCPNMGASFQYFSCALSLSPAGAGGIACGQQRKQSHILRVEPCYCWK